MKLSDRMGAPRRARPEPLSDDGERSLDSARASDPLAELKTRVWTGLIRTFEHDRGTDLSSPENRERLNAHIDALIATEEHLLSSEERISIRDAIAAEVIGHGPLQPLLDDPSVTEIMVNAPDLIFIERGGRLEETDAAFFSVEHLRRVIDRIVGNVGRQINESAPLVDARMDDGSRVNAIIPPLAIDGPQLTIRKFSDSVLGVETLIENGSISREGALFLQAAVEAECNVIVSGGTGWEESGIVRLYLNPGPEKVAQNWPAVTVGRGKSPEDAVAFDVDGDGMLDVVSCHEGKQRQILAHRFVGKESSWEDLLNKSNWNTQSFDQLDGQMWMFAATIQLRDGTESLIAGAKGSQATLTLLIPPSKQRHDLKTWKTTRLRNVGWIMSLLVMDMDNDQDDDLVFSDRKGAQKGVSWLEQPDTNPSTTTWTEHRIGAKDQETLFIDASPDRILASTRNDSWLEFKRIQGEWAKTVHPNPASIPHGKAVKRLGKSSLIMTSNTASDRLKPKRPGIWLKQGDENWSPIGAETSTKFDRIECIDLDNDGDLDVMTCEERRNLGVVWYENPGVVD